MGGTTFVMMFYALPSKDKTNDPSWVVPFFSNLLLLIICFRHLLLLVVYFCYACCLSLAFTTLVIHCLFFSLFVTFHHSLLNLLPPHLLFVDCCSLSFVIVFFYSLPFVAPLLPIAFHHLLLFVV
jgi:hypothetical protein